MILNSYFWEKFLASLFAFSLLTSCIDLAGFAILYKMIFPCNKEILKFEEIFIQDVRFKISS